MSATIDRASNRRQWLAGALWRASTEEWRGWTLWVVFALFTAVTQLPVPPFSGNVFRVYRDAGCNWLAGQPLYDGTGNNFLYLPQCAMLCVPMAFLPFQWAGFLWRIFNIAVFAVGVWRFVRLAGRDRSPPMFPWVSLCVILLSASAARHGQMTMIMGGLMLLAVVDLADERWWRAVFWMALGVALKPLMIVLVLLAAVLYPRTSWRMALSLTLLVLLPFLAQRPDYVVEQYRLSMQTLQDAKELGTRNEFPHLFWVLKSAGLSVPPVAQTVVRLVVAALTLAMCWLVKRRCNAVQAAVMLYTLAVAYLMLFNPRTEHNSYCLITPPLAIYATQAVWARRWSVAAILTGMALAMLLSYPLGKIMPTVWLKPVLCIVFVAIVCNSRQETPCRRQDRVRAL
jgi:hypothetical protein